MQTIYLDISNKGVIPCIVAKQSEVGRKFVAIITDNGVPYNIAHDSLLSVWYEGDTDAGNYSSIEEKSAFSIDGNKVTVELVAQMLLKPGKGEMCLSVSHADGGETNTWNIPYCVEYKPGAGSHVPTEYYTALTDAAARAAEKVGLAAEQAGIASEQANIATEQAQLAQAWAESAERTVKGIISESEEYPGCFYKAVDGDVLWINPPSVLDEEYKLAERFLGENIYQKTFKYVNTEAIGSADAIQNINIPHGVDGLSGIIDWRCSYKSASGQLVYTLPTTSTTGGSAFITGTTDAGGLNLRLANYTFSANREFVITIKYTKEVAA